MAKALPGTQKGQALAPDDAPGVITIRLNHTEAKALALLRAQHGAEVDELMRGAVKLALALLGGVSLQRSRGPRMVKTSTGAASTPGTSPQATASAAKPTPSPRELRDAFERMRFRDLERFLPPGY